MLNQAEVLELSILGENWLCWRRKLVSSEYICIYILHIHMRHVSDKSKPKPPAKTKPATAFENSDIVDTARSSPLFTPSNKRRDAGPMLSSSNEVSLDVAIHYLADCDFRARC